MKVRWITAILSVSALMVTQLFSQAQVESLVTTDDSFVYHKITEPGVYDDTNYDQDSFGLRVRSGSGTHWRRALLKFDISTITAENVDSVELKLTIEKIINYSPTDGVCWIFKVEDNTWTEEAVTWNNQPTRGVSIAFQDSLPGMSSSDPDTTLYFNVTGYVLEMLGLGNNQISFMVDDSTESGIDDGFGIDVRYYSKEKANPELGADSASVYPMLLVYSTTVTGVADNGDDLPRGFALHQNYPNPFNPTTTINYSVDRSGLASLVVYDIRGQHVKTLAYGYTAAGDHSVTWDGTNDDGRTVAGGIYFCRMEYAGGTSRIKLAFIK